MLNFAVAIVTAFLPHTLPRTLATNRRAASVVMGGAPLDLTPVSEAPAFSKRMQKMIAEELDKECGTLHH